MPETSIVVKAEDRYSSAVKAMSAQTKVFCKDQEEMERILAAKMRTAAGMTAPPQGLCLEAVDYDPPFLPPSGRPGRNFW